MEWLGGRVAATEGQPTTKTYYMFCLKYQFNKELSIKTSSNLTVFETARKINL